MQLKKIIFTLLVVVIALTTLTFGAAAADATTADFTVSISGTVNAAGEIVYAPGETIDVVIDVNNNPGIALLEVHVKYDATVLAPVKDADGIVYETGAFLDEDHVTDFSKEGVLVFKSQVKMNPKPIVDEDGNIIKSGEIAKFSFKVLEGAHADASSIKISDASALTSNYDFITINTTDAKFAIHSLNVVKGKEATCTSKGMTDAISCSKCDYVVSVAEELPALDHPEEYRESFGAVEGNCTTPAVSAGVKCTLCGTTLVDPVTGDSVAHVPSGTWITVKEATHFEAGLKKQECKNCGETAIEETIAVKTEHEYDAGVITTEPTCTDPGEITYTCPCGDKYTENIAPIAHTVVEDKAVEPTYSEPGKTAGTHCSVCGAVLVPQTELAQLSLLWLWSESELICLRVPSVL